MSGYRDKRVWAWNGEIGPFLEKAREKRGLSLKEAERSTRIRSRYLQSLEREDPGELPGKSYAQGFLRSYAEFLGLDVEELSRRFKRHDGSPKPRREERKAVFAGEAAHPSQRTGKPAAMGRVTGRRMLITLSLLVMILLLSAAAFYALLGGPLSPEAPISREELPAAEGGSPQGGVQPEPAPTLEEKTRAAEGQLRATVSVQGAESWISVESESGVAYTGIAQPGFTRRFEADRSFMITTGNAGAVELRINGIDYGVLGESGEVTSRSFTLKRER